MSSPYAPPGATPDPYGRPGDAPAGPLEDDIERGPETIPVAEPEAATGYSFPPETGSATSQGESGGAVEQVKAKANEAAGTAKDEAAGVVEDAKASASDVLGTTASEAGKVATEAKDQAGSLLHEAAHAVREQSATGKDRAATGLRALSGELSSLADGAQEPGMAADLARQAGDRLGGAASWLEDRDIDGVLEDVQDFARRRPLTFLAIAVGAGVVVGRLARALKDAPSTPAARPAVDRSAVTGARTPGSYGTPAVGALGVAPLPGRHAVGDTLSSPADALAVDPETAAPNRPGSPW